MSIRSIISITVVIGIATLVMAGFGITNSAAQDLGENNSTTIGTDIQEINHQPEIDLIARSEPGESITVEVGETVSLGFPRDRFPVDGNYQWEIVEGPTKDDDQLLHTSTENIGDEVDLEIGGGFFEESSVVTAPIPPHNARVTSFRPSKKGTYKIEGTAEKEDGSEETSNATINVTKRSDMDLLKKHAPVLNFHREEQYYPTRIEAIFENSFLCEKGGLISPPSISGASATLYDEVSSEEDTEDMYLQPYPLLEEMDTDDMDSPCSTPRFSFPSDGSILEDYNPEETVYPKTVYGVVKEDVSFDPSENDTHRNDYENAEFEVPDEGGEYTAVGYWMIYVNDPKPHDERGLVSFENVAAHTGDGEPIWILLDKNDNPEWILAQQHKGGEYRRWEHVQKKGEGSTHPVINVADGAHSNYLSLNGEEEPENTARSVADAPDDPQYIYQRQYLCPITCGDARGSTNPAIVLDIGYTDQIGYEGASGVGRTWSYENGDYEIAVLTGDELTGDEAWGNYEGDILRYSTGSDPGGKTVPISEGDIPQQGDSWNPGEWGIDRLFADVAQDGDHAQIDAVFSESSETFDIPGDIGDAPEEDENIQEDIVTPDGRDLECGDYLDIPGTCDDVEGPPPVVAPNQIEDDSELIGWAEADGNIGVNLINTGMQPHEFTLDLKATELGSENQADYSFYVNSIFPKNVAGAYVPLSPLEITESDIRGEGSDIIRDIEFDTSLWVHPDDYELDDRSFKLRLTDGLPEPSLEIDEDETIDAGTVNESRTVGVDVSVKGSDQLSGDYEWSVYVDGEEVRFYDDGSLLTYGKDSSDSDGEVYHVVFWAPDVDEPGTYDVRVELDTEDETVDDEKEDLVAYGEPGKPNTKVYFEDDFDYSSVGASPWECYNRPYGHLNRYDKTSTKGSCSISGSTAMVEEESNRHRYLRRDITLPDTADDISIESRVRGRISARWSDSILAIFEPDVRYPPFDGGGRRSPIAVPFSIDSSSSFPGRVVTDWETVTDDIKGEGGEKIQLSMRANGRWVFDRQETLSWIEVDHIRVGDFEGTPLIISESEGTLAPDETEVEEIPVGSDVTEIEFEFLIEALEGVSPLSRNSTVSPLDESNTVSSLEEDYINASVFTQAIERDVRLYKPDGTQVNASDTNTEISEVGDKTVYRIENPEPGDWRYEIDGGDTGADFDVNVSTSSLTKLNVETLSDEYYTGTDAALTATLFGAEPVRDANVEAEVETPNGSSKIVTLEEVAPGIYRATVGLEEGVSGTYEATVRATQDEKNVERRATTTWDAEYAAPVSVGQPDVPVVDPGTEGETEFVVESEALLGIRSVELGVSEFTHETTEATIPGWRVSMDRSHLIRSGEDVEVDASVDVPDGTPTGTYTAEASAQVDEGGTTVDEVELRVGDGGGTACIDRRDAGRGETDELCDGEREMGRGGGGKSDGRYDRGTDRRERGRGSERGGNGQRNRGR